MPLSFFEAHQIIVKWCAGKKKEHGPPLSLARSRARAFKHARGPSIARNEMYKWATLLLVSGFSSELMILSPFAYCALRAYSSADVQRESSHAPAHLAGGTRLDRRPLSFARLAGQSAD